jgi:hypothetical protein
MAGSSPVHIAGRGQDGDLQLHRGVVQSRRLARPERIAEKRELDFGVIPGPINILAIHDPCLARVQFELAGVEPLPDVIKHKFRLPLALAVKHRIVGIPDAGQMPCHPQIKCIVRNPSASSNSWARTRVHQTGSTPGSFITSHTAPVKTTDHGTCDSAANTSKNPTNDSPSDGSTENASIGINREKRSTHSLPYYPCNRDSYRACICSFGLNREEFVVVGWTDPEGARPLFGALLPEAKAGTGAWLDFYNEERQHQSLGYRTPRKIYDEGLWICGRSALPTGAASLASPAGSQSGEMLAFALRPHTHRRYSQQRIWYWPGKK